MTEQTRVEDVRVYQPRFLWLSAIATGVFFGMLLLFFFKGDWFPNWIELGVYLFFILFYLVVLAHWSIVEVWQLPPFPKSEFKPYWFWYLMIGSVVLTVLSWVIVLLVRNLVWFCIAAGTTIFLPVVCWICIKRTLQQM